MHPRRNWDSPSLVSEFSLPPEQGWWAGCTFCTLHNHLRVRGWGNPNSDDWRKRLALCLLCELSQSTTTTFIAILPSKRRGVKGPLSACCCFRWMTPRWCGSDAGEKPFLCSATIDPPPGRNPCACRFLCHFLPRSS
jgi:hypothetical protein